MFTSKLAVLIPVWVASIWLSYKIFKYIYVKNVNKNLKELKTINKTDNKYKKFFNKNNTEKGGN